MEHRVGSFDTVAVLDRGAAQDRHRGTARRTPREKALSSKSTGCSNLGQGRDRCNSLALAHTPSPMALAFETPNSLRRKSALAAVQRKPAPHGRPALGAILVERQLITEDQLKAAIDQQKRTDRRIGQVLIDMGATTQDAVLGALSIQLGLPGIRINAYTIDAEAID